MFYLQLKIEHPRKFNFKHISLKFSFDNDVKLTSKA